MTSDLLMFQLDAFYRFYAEVAIDVDGRTEAERELARQDKGVRASVNNSEDRLD